MTTKPTPTTARDARPPSGLVRGPADDARDEAERLRAALVALERVRTQLAKTQRTLDAFVAQITGTPDGSHMRTHLPPAPQPSAGSAPPAPRTTASTDPRRFDPPEVLAGHLRPTAELQPPPLPPVPRPSAPAPAVAVPGAPVATTPRRATPAPLVDHVKRPGERPPVARPGGPDPAVDAPMPAAPAAGPVAPRTHEVAVPSASHAVPAAPAAPAAPDVPPVAAERAPAQLVDLPSHV
ncbi:hypothetical protein [Patulibacter sp.]|uniref:hypothetical protein n=1 Tax=Patulibacter sp. TaxID=1912859 RepID=UPI002724A1C8|nr:hypothetical protein [Patulibacter sp.]MDO9407143.1 hypothetical protein [Patulibacter sp.]